mmetsp:Transcript_13850/g.36959  ORF Transcript_13850/g.36959 Transcript_13850/m.36959 type:complete len:192 (+) Transcript_13850:1-576(+)
MAAPNPSETAHPSDTLAQQVNEDWIDWLRSSDGLGKVIHFLAENDPHPPNARLAKKLMDSWSKVLFEQSSEHQMNRHMEYEQVQIDPTKKRKQIGEASLIGLEDKATAELRKKREQYLQGRMKHRAMRPEPVPMNFKKMPKSTINYDAKDFKKGESAQGKRLDKAVQKMKQSFKKQSRAVDVTREGSGLGL